MGHASTRVTVTYGGQGGGASAIAPTAILVDSSKPVKIQTRSLRAIVDTIQGIPASPKTEKRKRSDKT